MSTTDISKVLSSGSRWKILTALSTGPKDVRGIVKEAAIQPTAVRYHIQSLLRFGLVDSFEEKGGVGRPKVFYRLAKKQVAVGFPPRHYLSLSEILLSSVKKLIDQEKIRSVIYKTSGEYGKSMMSELALRYNVSKWTPSQLDKYFVSYLLPEFGSQSETVKMSSKEVVFRSYTCPFQELSVKYPEYVCDIIHEGWLEGVGEIIDPKVKTRRLRCMGSGDEYCENSIQWSV